MFPASIPKEEIQQLPLIRFSGKIHVIDTAEGLKEVIRELRNQEVLGFDTETKPTFNKGDYNETALVQLSTLQTAFIIRIKEIGITDGLKSIFEDPSIIKVGISIRDDLKELRKSRVFRPAGFLDLNDVARELGIKQIGVRNLSGIFLKGRISKSQQTSNWESQELSAAQQSYAATDAWVCVKIHEMLKSKGFI